MSLNLATILYDSARNYADQIALISEERSFSFVELEDWAKRIASALKSIGIKRGDHVALMVPNVPEFTAAYFGILALGAVVVPVNTMLLENEIAYVLEHSDARCFICWSAYGEKCFKAFHKVDYCKNLFFFGEGSEQARVGIRTKYDYSNGLSVAALEPFLKDADSEIDIEQTGPDETAVILYTSGTTGRPKGAELSHFNMYSNAFYTANHSVQFYPDDVGLGILPLFHSFGQTVVQNAMIIAGAKMVLVPQFEPKKTLPQIEKHRITFIAAVPTMLHLLLQNQKRHAVDASSLRLVVSGGASLPIALSEEFERVFGIVVSEGYGLSETSPITNYTAGVNENHKRGSIGPQIVGTHVRIMRDDGSFAEPNEVGELVVRGHNLMKGYYKDPLATKSVMQNGWFRTGDVARMDEDGYFYIVDRKKDVIIRAGMNIYPREIEEVLLNHPSVQEVSVVGIEDETLSENIVAFVVLREDNPCTSTELLRYCREKLAPFKCPKVMKFLDSLPKGPSGKILKRELKNL